MKYDTVIILNFILIFIVLFILILVVLFILILIVLFILILIVLFILILIVLFILILVVLFILIFAVLFFFIVIFPLIAFFFVVEEFYIFIVYEIPKDVLNRFYKREISTIYQDTTEFTSDHRSHCPLEELEECIPADLRRNVFCMHFTTDFTEKLKKKGFVDTQVKGNYSYVTAKITEEMFREEQMDLMKDFWHDGSVKELVQTLTHTISKEEKEELKDLINDLDD